MQTAFYYSKKDKKSLKKLKESKYTNHSLLLRLIILANNKLHDAEKIPT